MNYELFLFDSIPLAFPSFRDEWIDTLSWNLEKSQTPFVQFQAATAIKEAIIREWALHSKESVSELRTYLLAYVSQRAE